MKRVCRLLAVVALLAAFPSPAAEVYLTTVTSTGTSVISPQIESGRKVMIQCDGTAYVAWGPSTVTVSSSTGIKLAADATYDSSSGLVNSYLAVISASGTVNCKIFRVLGVK